MDDDLFLLPGVTKKSYTCLRKNPAITPLKNNSFELFKKKFKGATTLFPRQVCEIFVTPWQQAIHTVYYKITHFMCGRHNVAQNYLQFVQFVFHIIPQYNFEKRCFSKTAQNAEYYQFIKITFYWMGYVE